MQISARLSIKAKPILRVPSEAGRRNVAAVLGAGCRYQTCGPNRKRCTVHLALPVYLHVHPHRLDVWLRLCRSRHEGDHLPDSADLHLRPGRPLSAARSDIAPIRR